MSKRSRSEGSAGERKTSAGAAGGRETSAGAARERKTSAARPDLGDLFSPDFFKALCDPTRLGILCRMVTSPDAQTVSEIGAGCPIDISVVSRHLRQLREAGIVACERKGKEVYCRLEAKSLVRSLRAVADAIESCCANKGCCGGNDDAAGSRHVTRK